MAQTAMTFTMKGDELHPMTLCHDTYGMDIYVPMNAPPIGQGSYGAVYKSYKLIQGRFKPCVVKAIPLHLGDRNPIEMEFQTLCSVSGIAGAGKIMQGPVYSLTHGFVVTEFVPGNTLTQHFHSTSSMMNPDALRLTSTWRTRMLQQLCLQIFEKLIATVQTVSKVHAAGIFHRDLKLCNIIIDRPRGSACLLDFGLAEASPTGIVKGHKGTLCYLAPEHITLAVDALAAANRSGKPPVNDFELDGCAADMFALGLVAYQFLTMRFPFPTLMTSQDFLQELQRDAHQQMYRLKRAYYDWQVSWADDRDPRWVYLRSCTADPAVFKLVRSLLAPNPRRRPRDLTTDPFMQLPCQQPCWLDPKHVRPPLLPVFSPKPAQPPGQTSSHEHSLMQNSASVSVPGYPAGMVLGSHIELVPIPGLHTVLWDPHNPLFNTITGPCYRCFVTQEYVSHCGSDMHAEAGPALVRVTDLFGWPFLGQQPHQPQPYARATSLASHLNQGVALLKRACQASPAASPLPHLDEDVQYTILRLPGSSRYTWPEALQTCMDVRMQAGYCIHPFGIQVLATRLLKVLAQVHSCQCHVGGLNPATIVLAPEAYLIDASMGFVPSRGWLQQCLGLLGTPAMYMAPETFRAQMGTSLPGEPVASPAADIFSLGALLNVLLLGTPSNLPMQPAEPAGLSPNHNLAPVKWCAPIESILHEQALLFVNGLMAPPMANRPTAEQALQHSFLSAACLVSAEKDMRLCLPGFDAKRDLLPAVPVGRSCHLPAAAMGGGWGIAALHATPPMQSHATPPMQPHATQALGVVPNPAATQQADWDSLSPDSAAAAPTGHRQCFETASAQAQPRHQPHQQSTPSSSSPPPSIQVAAASAGAATLHDPTPAPAQQHASKNTTTSPAGAHTPSTADATPAGPPDTLEQSVSHPCAGGHGMASAASDGGAEPQADQQADPQADPQADQQADNTAMPTQGQPLRHHSQPPQSAIPSPPTGSSTPSSPQLTAAPAGAATGHHQGHTQAHHPAYAQAPAQQHALDNTATAPAASAAVHHHHPTHARAPAQKYVPDSATTSPSAPQPYLPADAEAPTTLEQSVSRHPPALNSARSARADTVEDGPQDISEMPRDAEQPAMQSSQAVPAGHLHQGLADSAGGSIRPGRPSAAVPSPGELDILSGGVAPTGMTPFDCLSRADAPHDSSAHQQHVPASQQPAHAGSGSGLSPSCVPADESPMHEANRSEPVHGVPLSDQPEVFACPQTDREVQQWSAMFAQAYLQTGSEPVQHGVPASQAQTPGDSGGQQWQPADGSSSFGHVQGSADNLQRSDLADLLDGPGLHGDDLWLVAFLLQVHLQGCLVSMQRADLDEAVEAFASSMSGPDSMQRNVAPDGVAAASLRGTQESAVNGFDSQDHHPVPHMPSLLHSSSSSSATGMGSHTDSVPSEADDTSVIDIDDVEVIPALRPQFEDSFPSQQHFGPRSPALSAHMQEAEGYRRHSVLVSSLANRAVGWGYCAAGVVCGSCLGLMKGIRK